MLFRSVRLEWNPALYAVSPSVEEVGIENLAIEFPPQQYAGHHIEPGFNAIAFEGVRNCWARHLRITNADSGIFFRERTKFTTASDLLFTADKSRLRTGYGSDSGESRTLAVGGHHGILFDGFSQDNLVENFNFEVRFLHDIGVSAWSAGNVYSNGRGLDMDFDHHRRAPYENLFTELQAGEGTRLWENGGDLSDGPPSGARETFWNIQTVREQSLPDWAVEGNFVGVKESSADKLLRAAKDMARGITGGDGTAVGNWWDAAEPGKIIPENIYIAQRDRRKNTMAVHHAPPTQTSAK